MPLAAFVSLHTLSAYLLPLRYDMSRVYSHFSLQALKKKKGGESLLPAGLRAAAGQIVVVCVPQKL